MRGQRNILGYMNPIIAEMQAEYGITTGGAGAQLMMFIEDVLGVDGFYTSLSDEACSRRRRMWDILDLYRHAYPNSSDGPEVAVWEAGKAARVVRGDSEVAPVPEDLGFSAFVLGSYIDRLT